MKTNKNIFKPKYFLPGLFFGALMIFAANRTKRSRKVDPRVDPK